MFYSCYMYIKAWTIARNVINNPARKGHRKNIECIGDNVGRLNQLRHHARTHGSPGWWIIRWRKIRNDLVGARNGEGEDIEYRGEEGARNCLDGVDSPPRDKMVPRAFRTFFSTEMNFRRVRLSFPFLPPALSISLCLSLFPLIYPQQVA